MKRKAALVGCREGQWIRTSDMPNLRLKAQVQQDVLLHVRQHGEAFEAHFIGPGVYELQAADWTCVSIVDGPHEHALCFLEAVA